MKSDSLCCDITMSGNAFSGSHLLFSNLFKLFPDSFHTISSYFERDYNVINYNDSGFDSETQDRKLRHQSLSGYADDLIRYLEENRISNIIYMAHSINGLLAFIAAAKAPHLFERIILTSASPCLLYSAGDQYLCGFPVTKLTDLFDILLQEKTTGLLPQPNHPVQLTDILSDSFLKMNANEAYAVFSLLFSTDCRPYLTEVPVPFTILQVSGDKVATSEAGYFMYRNIPHSQLVRIRAKGQMPHVEAPEEIIMAMKFFINFTVH